MNMAVMLFGCRQGSSKPKKTKNGKSGWPGGPSELSLVARVLTEDEEYASSPVSLRWRLEGADTQHVFAEGSVSDGLLPGEGQAFRAGMQPDRGLPDGSYDLVLFGRDLAGNEAHPIRTPMVVALSGPTLGLVEPGGGLGHAEPPTLRASRRP